MYLDPYVARTIIKLSLHSLVLSLDMLSSFRSNFGLGFRGLGVSNLSSSFPRMEPYLSWVITVRIGLLI